MEENRKYTFLLIDDNPGDLILLKGKLTTILSNSQFEFASSGMEAMDYLLKRADGGQALPSMVFLDLQLPDTYGLDILQKIKSHEILRVIPVVVVSETKNQQDIVQTYKLGGTFFMSKSSDIGILKEVIHQLKVKSILKF